MYVEPPQSAKTPSNLLSDWLLRNSCMPETYSCLAVTVGSKESVTVTTTCSEMEILMIFDEMIAICLSRLCVAKDVPSVPNEVTC